MVHPVGQDADFYTVIVFVCASMLMPKRPRNVGVITIAEDHNWWLVLRPKGT